PQAPALKAVIGTRTNSEKVINLITQLNQAATTFNNSPNQDSKKQYGVVPKREAMDSNINNNSGGGAKEMYGGVDEKPPNSPKSNNSGSSVPAWKRSTD